MSTACTEPTCGTSCESQLPIVNFNFCDPKVKFGQIEEIYITNPGNPLIDETDITEWNTRLALPNNNPAKIIRLDVIGDKPAAAANVVTISKFRKVQGNKDHTLNIKVDDLSDENYDMMRAFECGKVVKMWYVTVDGDLFGGAAGIDASVILNHVIPVGAQDIQVIEGTLTWRAKFHPCRTAFVLAGTLQGS